MKKFVLHILGLLAGLLLIMTVLDIVYTEVYRNSPPRTKIQYLRSLKNKKIDYLFLGSSRVENGINPLLIEKQTHKTCINLGIPASKLNDIYTVLQLLESYHVEYGRAFIQVDYIFNMNERSNILQYQFIPFIRDNEKTKECFRYLDNFDACYYLPFYRYCVNDYRIGLREAAMNFSGGKKKVIENKGFVPRFDVADKKSDVSLPGTILKNNPAFDSIVSYCKKNNIKVTYFCTPFMSGTKNMEFMDKLRQKIPGLKDYSQLIANDSLFSDGRHLNNRGATYFTNHIVSDLGLK